MSCVSIAHALSQGLIIIRRDSLKCYGIICLLQKPLGLFWQAFSLVGLVYCLLFSVYIVLVLGDPDPPLDLTHDMSANTVSSAVITWDSPSTTGGDGISITGYRIMSSDNGLNLNVTVDDITYTITGLQYNTNYSVNVTAINSCGLESGPADVVVNIEARG